MCGNFGCQLKSNTNAHVARVAMTKVKILGLYNQSRGRDSCGIAIDSEIYKGVSDKKHWDDFIEGTILPNPKTDMTLIGHTRSSTKGANTGENAHPFLINGSLVGAHNGVIQNIDDLCKKYELDPKDYAVDSLALYHLLEKEGFGILDEYVGFAALAFKWLEDPNTLYLYHGSSKNYKTGNPVEERPMYYMETPEGIYYSSLITALNAIRESEEEKPTCLNYNVVFEIKNGAFTKWQHPVNRLENNVYATTNVNAGNASKATNQSSSGTSILTNTDRGTKSASGAGAVMNSEPLIMKETLPRKVVQPNPGDVVYFHFGRYWRIPRTLAHGQMFLLDRGYVSELSVPSSKEFWFFKGVMLKNKGCFEQLTAMEKHPSSFIHNKSMNFAAAISKFAQHPVTNLMDQAVNLSTHHRFAWYMDDKRAGGSFTAKFSGRHYSLANGFLQGIKSSHKGEQTLYNDFHAASLEVQVFEKGGVLGTSGGVPEEDPFHDSTKDGKLPELRSLLAAARRPTGSEDNTAYTQWREREVSPKESNEAPFWYEVRFRSFEEAMSVIGDLEVEALRRYVKQYLEEASGIDADKREVELAACDLIVTAVNSNYSFLELCESEEDRYKFKNAYQWVCDDQNEKNFMADVARNTVVIDAETSVQEYERQVSELLNLDVKNTEDMSDVKSAIEGTVQTLSDMLVEAETLVEDQENDASQELAATLYKGVSSIQGNLAKVAEKYNYPELAAQIKNLNSTRAEV